MVNENNRNSIRQLIKSNGKSYIEIYKKANKLKVGYKNLEILQGKNKNLKNELKAIKEKIKCRVGKGESHP